MPVASPLRRRQTVAVLLILTAVTGLVDAVSYLRLGRVFVANMTGNVVFLGFSVSPDSGLSALASAIAIGGFVLGALIGGQAGARLTDRPRRWLVAACAAEALVLAVVAVLCAVGILSFAGRGGYVTVALLAAALGLQNSTVRRLGAADLTTTVLTLALTGLIADSALAGGAGAKPHRRLGSVVTMLAGAAVGAVLLQVSTVAVIALAAICVAAVAAVFATGAATPRENDDPGAV